MPISLHIWLGHQIVKYHHTIEEYFDLFTATGFKLEQIREARPQAENFVS